MAGLKMMFAQSKGAENTDIFDYLPHFDPPEMTVEDAYEMWMGAEKS